jgi:hypothetical protein
MIKLTQGDLLKQDEVWLFETTGAPGPRTSAWNRLEAQGWLPVQAR